MQFITFIDFVLLPLYVVVIFLLARALQERWYPHGHPWRKHFMNGLLLKMGGAIAIGFIYQYYYVGIGDTFSYYEDGMVMSELFSVSPAKWINLLMMKPQWYEGDYMNYISRFNYYDIKSNHYVGSLCSILGLFSFNRFLLISLLFSVISFTGIWALFRTFAKQYPHLTQPIALSILYIPSVAMWGSGIFKDTICLFALGWLTHSMFRLLINLKLNPIDVMVAFMSLFIIAQIKVYILVAFVPAISFWTLAVHVKKVDNFVTRFFLRISVFGLLAVGLVFMGDVFKKELGRYALDEVFKTSEALRVTIGMLNETEGGTGYNLGKISPNNIYGLLKKAPAAVNVTLFRPYIWESRKLFILLNSLESLALLLITVFVFWKVGVQRSLRAIFHSPNLQFLLLFTLVFAFAIGISTYNFGTLSRYRIPCLPFYGVFLCLLYYEYGDKGDEATNNNPEYEIPPR